MEGDKCGTSSPGAFIRPSLRQRRSARVPRRRPKSRTCSSQPAAPAHRRSSCRTSTGRARLQAGAANPSAPNPNPPNPARPPSSALPAPLPQPLARHSCTYPHTGTVEEAPGEEREQAARGRWDCFSWQHRQFMLDKGNY